MDITPTLYDLAGIDPDRHLDGRSLVPLWTETATDWEQDVMCVFNGHHFAYQSRMVTDGRYKYVFNAPEIDEFYDLEADPWELSNLIAASSYEKQVSHMRARLVHWIERAGDPLTPWIMNRLGKRVRTGPDEYTPYRS